MKEHAVSRKEILIFTFISLAMVLLLWDSSSPIGFGIYNLFTPFKLYTTTIHEAWHAAIALLTGGIVSGEVNGVELGMHLDLDGSGHVVSAGGIEWLIISAGYIGCAITGAILIISSQNKLISKSILLFLSVSIMIITVVYIKDIVSLAFLSSMIVSTAIIFSCLKTNFSSHIAIFLGTLLAVDSFSDMKKIVADIPYQTDAGILARHIGVEFLTIPIAILFSVICMYIWYASIKVVFKKQRASQK